MKKSKLTLFLAMIFMQLTVVNASAMDITQASETAMDKVTVTLNCDESFSERVEIYFDGIPRTALWYDPDMEQNGYHRTVYIERGEYDLKVLSSTDIDDQYEFTTAKSINTEKEDSITIQVSENDTIDEAEYEGDEHLPHEMPEAPLVEPAYYDFSEGKPAGTMTIEAVNCAAVKSLVYTLVGEDNIYEITLDNDHVFQATVDLPLGSYYESSTIQIELDPDAYANEGVEFLWVHKNNVGFFGNYYDITENNIVSVDDLTVYMVKDGEQMEINGNVLFGEKRADNVIQAQQEHQQKELESAFPELYETKESETETIATALPIEESAPADYLHIVIIVSLLLVIIIVATVCVTRFRRKH